MGERLTDEEYAVILAAIQGFQDHLASLPVPSGKEWKAHQERMASLAEAKAKLRRILG